MQVTGGEYKGIKLTPPTGVRPTLSMVRESVFSILKSYFMCADDNFSKLKFLDVYTGSAIMALEAYSRGFGAVGIEKNVKIARVAKLNFEKLKIAPKIIIGDALRVLKKLDEKFDVIYIDPPWEEDYKEVLKLAYEKLSLCGIIILEHDKTKKLEFNICDNFEIFKEKIYGRVVLTLIRAKQKS